MEKKIWIIISSVLIILILLGGILLINNKPKISDTVKQQLWKGTPNNSTESINTEPVSTGVNRYFISNVELKEKKYAPALKECLPDKEMGKLYIDWSAIYYPSIRPYEVSLVRINFVNKDYELDKKCFIKEIITEEDWKEVENKYRLSKSDFGV